MNNIDKTRQDKTRQDKTRQDKLVSPNKSVKPVLVGGFGEKRSNGGTQWFFQDRVYDAESISLCIATAFNPSYLIKMQAK